MQRKAVQRNLGWLLMGLSALGLMVGVGGVGAQDAATEMLVYGEAVLGSLEADGEAVYRFEGGLDDVVIVHVTGVTPGLNPTVALRTAAGDLLTRGAGDPLLLPGGNAAYISFRLPQPAVYTVAINGAGAGEFLLRLGARRADDVTPVLADSDVTLIDIPPGGASALVRFDTRPDALTRIQISADTPGFDVIAQVYDASGRLVTFARGSVLATEITLPPGDSRYDILLTAANPTASGVVRIGRAEDADAVQATATAQRAQIDATATTLAETVIAETATAATATAVELNVVETFAAETAQALAANMSTATAEAAVFETATAIALNAAAGTAEPTPPPLGVFPSPTLSAAQAGEQCRVSTDTGAVNIRSGPDQAFPPISSLIPGTTLDVVGRNADSSWYVVRLGDEVGGWVSASVTFLVGNCTALPVMTSNATIPPVPPTPLPTDTPTDIPTITPTAVPPTNTPTDMPTGAPTETLMPTLTATATATVEPPTPIESPTPGPSPTPLPTAPPDGALLQGAALTANSHEFTEQISFPQGDTTDLINFQFQPGQGVATGSYRFTLMCSGVGAEMVVWEIVEQPSDQPPPTADATAAASEPLRCDDAATVTFGPDLDRIDLRVDLSQSTTPAFIRYTIEARRVN
ncbi:MAG: SH3 domain-containing protein [Chloroflexi bacterium]|nr:SH3 domain-containing protein [Chloroflexota bacterium]